VAASSASELANDEVGEVDVEAEGLFAHGQHVIFGVGHDGGGPGGVGSGRGEGGSLSWRRVLAERDERAGTMRKPSSWGSGGLRR